MRLRILIFAALFAFTLGQLPPSNTSAAPQPAAPVAVEATTVAPPATTLPPAPQTTPVTSQPPQTTEPPNTTQPPPPPPTTQPPPPPTTQAPTTKPPPPPPTTPATPKAVTSSVRVKGSDDKYCVLIDGQFLFQLTALDKAGAQKTVEFYGTKDLDISGTQCTNDLTEQWVYASFIPEGSTTMYNLTFVFSRLDTTSTKDYYWLDNITLTFVYDDTYQATGQEILDSENLKDTYLVDKTYAYKCIVGNYTYLNGTNSHDTFVNLTMSKFTFQAFATQSSNDYGNFDECDADFTTSDIVPIAVGCALAALVVIVLIAYLIGRKRSRQKGYQSV